MYKMKMNNLLVDVESFSLDVNKLYHVGPVYFSELLTLFGLGGGGGWPLLRVFDKYLRNS